MPTENQPANWMPWVIIAVLLYLLWQDKKGDDPVPPPAPVENVESITKSVFADMRKSYAATFEEAAKQVSDKTLTSDRSLLDFVRPKIEQGRKDAQAKFDAMVEANIPQEFASDAEVARVAGFLRRIGKSW